MEFKDPKFNAVAWINQSLDIKEEREKMIKRKGDGKQQGLAAVITTMGDASNNSSVGVSSSGFGEEEQSKVIGDVLSMSDEDILMEIMKNKTVELQILEQDISNNVEKMMRDLIHNIPNAANDISRFEKDIQTIKSDFSSITKEVNSDDDNNGDINRSNRTREEKAKNFQVLSNLHKIKTNLEASYSMLEEAANWHRLVREADNCFSSRNLVQVATHLSSMRQSLLLLEGMPESQKRVDVAERMEQRLQSLIKPGLKDALADKSGDALREYVKIFSQLGMLNGLIEEYASSRIEEVKEKWISFKKECQSATPPSTPQQKFFFGLPKFYQDYIAFFDAEFKHCKEVFESEYALMVISQIVVQSIRPFADDFYNLMIGASASTKKELTNMLDSWEEIINAFGLTEGLGNHILNAIQSFSSVPAAVQLTISSPLKKVSLQKHESIEDIGASIVEALCAPFLLVYENYYDLESKRLAKNIQSSQSQQQRIQGANTTDDFLTEGDKLKSLLAADQIFTASNQAIDQCLTLTFGTELQKCFAIISKAIDNHSKYCIQLMEDFAKKGKSKGAEKRRDVIGILLSSSQLSQDLENFEIQVIQKLSPVCDDIVNMKGPQTNSQLIQTFLKFRFASMPNESLVLLKRLGHASSNFVSTEASTETPSIDSLATTIFGASSESIHNIIKTAQRLVFNALMEPIDSEIAKVFSLSSSVWHFRKISSSESTNEEENSGYNPESPYMTQIGDIIMTLVQELEPYSSSLTLSPFILPDRSYLLDGDKKGLTKTLGSDFSVFVAKYKQQEEEEASKSEAPSEMEADQSTATNETDNQQSTLGFSGSWLGITVAATELRLLREIFRVNMFTSFGAKQMAADVDYLQRYVVLVEGIPDLFLKHIHKVLSSNKDISILDYLNVPKPQPPPPQQQQQPISHQHQKSSQKQ